MSKVEPIKFSNQKATQIFEGGKKAENLLFKFNNDITPQERAENEKKAVDILKQEGYKLTSKGDGTYILEDVLGHKHMINNLGFNDRGVVSYTELMINYIDPSQKERYDRKVLKGEDDTPEDKAKYAKQSMDTARKAGYTIEDRSDGTYILTNPDGGRSVVNNFDIAYDGGAVWTTLPVHLDGEKPRFMLQEL